MLQIQHLTITHRRDLRVLLQDFSFALRPGDRAALIGEEGNGKSTLLRLLYREELVQEYVEYSGVILKNGEIPGYLPQELTEEEKRLPVSAFCAAVPAFYDASPRELAALAAQRGLDPAVWYDDRPLGGLSGGEKIRAAAGPVGSAEAHPAAVGRALQRSGCGCAGSVGGLPAGQPGAGALRVP